jgi:Fur family ferric uptake transcriptional regulator
MVRRRLPRISLGTVYRNLEVMAKMGIIQKLEPASAQKRFDYRTEKHYHVRCERCGRVADVAVDPVKDLEEIAQAGSDFDITGYRLEFSGLCPRCRRLGAKEKRVKSRG